MDWDATVRMVEATVQIEHTREEGGRRVATGFLVDAPYPDGTQRTVLITAAHAVGPETGTEIRVGWRFGNADGSWRFTPQPVPLQANGQRYWVRHPDRDIAAVVVRAPDEFARAAIPLAWLADARPMEQQGAGAGQEVFALGYPRGLAANRAGFPILRSGRLASYPLSPISAFPTFLIDMTMFPGNSGGPVWVDGPEGHPVVLGVVTQQVEQTDEHMGLGVVTQAAFVRETIALLDQARSLADLPGQHVGAEAA